MIFLYVYVVQLQPSLFCRFRFPQIYIVYNTINVIVICKSLLLFNCLAVNGTLIEGCKVIVPKASGRLHICLLNYSNRAYTSWQSGVQFGDIQSVIPIIMFHCTSCPILSEHSQ